LSPPARNAQFEYLNAQSRDFLARGPPVVSVDTKKKDLVGDCKTAGRTWRPVQQPLRVPGHDVPDPTQGKAVPSGVDDLGQNRGFVNVGTSHDTADFAVESLRLWWEPEGRARSPAADSRLVFADGGGSNSS